MAGDKIKGRGNGLVHSVIFTGQSGIGQAWFGYRTLASLRLTGVDATRGASFAHNDLAQGWQRRLKLLPDPTCNVLARRILQTLNFVEVVVVDPLFDGLECPFDVVEVHDPSELWIERAPNMDFDLKAMTVQTTAFVSNRNEWEAVGRFDRE